MAIERQPQSSGWAAKVLKTAQDDQWLPILKPPLRRDELDPRKIEVLELAANITGRLSIAVQSAYGEMITCSPSSSEILKAKGNKAIQFTIASSSDSASRTIALLKGARQRWGGPWACHTAKFVNTSQAEIERGQQHFLGVKGLRETPGTEALPYFRIRSWDPFEGPLGSWEEVKINGVSDSVLIRFYKSLKVYSLAHYRKSTNPDYLSEVSSWLFNWKDSKIFFTRSVELNDPVSFYYRDWRENVFSLNSDGFLRDATGKPKDGLPLGELLLASITPLPLDHFKKIGGQYQPLTPITPGV